MKPLLRNILGFSAAALLIAGTQVATSCLKGREPVLACETTLIHYADSLRFISEDEIRSIIDKADGIPVGKRLEDIGLEKIETALEASGVVCNAEAWVTGDGRLHVRVSQRTPVLKLVDGGREFFVDATGFEFPMQESFHGEVPQISCKAGCGEERNLELLEFISALRKSPFWPLGISDIEQSGDGEVTFRCGDRPEKFIFGKAAGPFDVRVDKLALYLDTIVPSLEDGKTYKTVNLKYDGQIVCK